MKKGRANGKLFHLCTTSDGDDNKIKTNNVIFGIFSPVYNESRCRRCRRFLEIPLSSEDIITKQFV